MRVTRVTSLKGTDQRPDESDKRELKSLEVEGNPSEGNPFVTRNRSRFNFRATLFFFDSVRNGRWMENMD